MHLKPCHKKQLLCSLDWASCCHASLGVRETSELRALPMLLGCGPLSLSWKKLTQPAASQPQHQGLDSLFWAQNLRSTDLVQITFVLAGQWPRNPRMQEGREVSSSDNRMPMALLGADGLRTGPGSGVGETAMTLHWPEPIPGCCCMILLKGRAFEGDWNRKAREET